MSDRQVPVNREFLSLDTTLDGWIHRPPARGLSRLLERTPVHPNAVTLASLVPAFAAAAAFAKCHLAWGLAGLGAFWLWAVLDHADGELARAKRLQSDFGRRLDDTCDIIASGVIMTGLFAGLVNGARLPHVPLWAEAFALGVLLNEIFGALATRHKRLVRERAVRERSAPERTVRTQKVLDHLSGREPFYFLILMALFAMAHPGFWPKVILTLMIAGTFTFAAISVGVWLTARFRHGRTV